MPSISVERTVVIICTKPRAKPGVIVTNPVNVDDHDDVHHAPCPAFLQCVFLYGLRALYSNYPPGSIVSLVDLDNVTASARRDLTSLSPLKRRPTTAPFKGGPPPAPPASTTTRVRWSTDNRRPRPDALYRYPFMDEDGTVDQILTGGYWFLIRADDGSLCNYTNGSSLHHPCDSCRRQTARRGPSLIWTTVSKPDKQRR